MKNDEKTQELKAGLLLLGGLGLTLLAIIVLGGKQNFFTSTITYRSHFPKVDGLVGVAKVVLGGLQIGSVNLVDFNAAARDIVVVYSVETKYS